MRLLMRGGRGRGFCLMCVGEVGWGRGRGVRCEADEVGAMDGERCVVHSCRNCALSAGLPWLAGGAVRRWGVYILHLHCGCRLDSVGRMRYHY